MDSLEGKRLVVTRPAGQATEFVEVLEGLGAQVVVVPLIEIVDPEDEGFAFEQAMKNLSQCEWVVCTSRNGAVRVAPYISSTDRLPKIAAVGIATGRVFSRRSDFVPTIADGATLAKEFPITQGKVLLVQAEKTSGNVARGLRSRGINVEEVVAYRTLDRIINSAERKVLRTADAIIFSSGSAVRSFVDQCGNQHTAVVVVIGESTQRVAHECGMAVTAVAEEPTAQSMFQLLGGIFR